MPLWLSGIGFHTLDDFDVMGRKVLLRIDINSPVDEKTLRLVDGSKIKSSVTSLRELLDREEVRRSDDPYFQRFLSLWFEKQ